MRFRLLISLFLVFATINSAFAQEDTLASWPVVERCLPTPTLPDDDWSYEGEIMLRGWAGIHGIRDGFDKPYVVNWGEYWGEGIISPNGEWILSQKNESFTEKMESGLGNYVIKYGDITVQNLVTGETIHFPWESLTQSGASYPWGPAKPIWLGNTLFVGAYGFGGNETKAGNLETGEITDRPDIDLSDYEYSVSPDQTRAVMGGALYNFATQEIINIRVSDPYDLQWTAWMSDSSHFIDLRRGDDFTPILTLFDRDGTAIAAPFASTAIRLSQFSPNGRYFSFSAIPLDENIFHSYMLDVQNHNIYDLCIMGDVWQMVWSPDSSQFSFVVDAGQQPIVVVDMDDWQARIVGYHMGSVMKWRSLP